MPDLIDFLPAHESGLSTMLSPLRFLSLPDGVVLVSTRLYSPYPSAERRDGAKPCSFMKYLRMAIDLALERSQLEGKRSVLMGMLSVCPSILTLFGRPLRIDITSSSTGCASSKSSSLPGVKRTLSEVRMVRDRKSVV